MTNFFKKKTEADKYQYAPTQVKKNMISSFEKASKDAGTKTTWDSGNIYPDCEVREYKGEKFVWYPPIKTYRSAGL